MNLIGFITVSYLLIAQAAQTLFVIYIRDSIALCFEPFKRKAYSGTLSRREIVRVNARLGEIRRDKEKLSSSISCELKRVKAS